MPRLGFKGPHKDETKLKISLKLKGKRPGGFNIKVECEFCKNKIAKPNLKRHQHVCERLQKSKHIFPKEMDLRSIKSFKRCLSQYGLTIEEYVSLYDNQNGICKICLSNPNSNKRLFVDHCHKTKKVRSLLCYHCNTLLGMCSDDINILESAIKYLNTPLH